MGHPEALGLRDLDRGAGCSVVRVCMQVSKTIYVYTYIYIYMYTHYILHIHIIYIYIYTSCTYTRIMSNCIRLCYKPYEAM